MPIADPRNRTDFRDKRKGGGARSPPRGAPRKRRHVSLSAVVCCACVTSMLCAVLFVSVLRNAMSIVNTPAKYRDQRWGFRKLNGFCSVSASWGRLGERGGLGPSVLSSPKMSPHFLGVSHGPLHPFVYVQGLTDAVVC